MNIYNKPSDLLKESAHPFDAACVLVSSLEDAITRVMIGKDVHKLSVKENDLFNLMVSIGLVKNHEGFIVAVIN